MCIARYELRKTLQIANTSLSKKMRTRKMFVFIVLIILFTAINTLKVLFHSQAYSLHSLSPPKTYLHFQFPSYNHWLLSAENAVSSRTEKKTKINHSN